MVRLRSPDGSISATFKHNSENFDLIGAIILAKEIQKEKFLGKNVMASKISRANFSVKIKNDIILFKNYERMSRPCCFENLFWFEKHFHIRIFIWQKMSSRELLPIYQSSLSDLKAIRLNILSLNSESTSLR
jgi:hypothetical protein